MANLTGPSAKPAHPSLAGRQNLITAEVSPQLQNLESETILEPYWSLGMPSSDHDLPLASRKVFFSGFNSAPGLRSSGAPRTTGLSD